MPDPTDPTDQKPPVDPVLPPIVSMYGLRPAFDE